MLVLLAQTVKPVTRLMLGLLPNSTYLTLNRVLKKAATASTTVERPVANVIHHLFLNPVVTPVIAAGSKVVKAGTTIKKQRPRGYPRGLCFHKYYLPNL